MNLYIDEAGTITTSTCKFNRFFIISYIQTNKPEQVIREFRKAKVDFIKNHPSCSLNIKSEIKGSEMPYGMKSYIFNRLSKNTDVTFHYKIIDNFSLDERLLVKPSISFNYFVGLSIKNIRNHLNNYENKLFLLIDERNQSVESLNSLQEYLMIEYSIKKNYYEKIKVRYKDSQSKDLIQLADIFANTVYRVCKSYIRNAEDKKNTSLLKCCNTGRQGYFPYKKKDPDFFI